jgi:chromosomal replication initiator protein
VSDCANLVDKSSRAAWDECLIFLSERIKKESFSTWLKPTRGIEFSQDSLTIAVPNQFVADWIKEHYWDDICHAISEVLGNGIKPVFKILTELGEEKSQLELTFPLTRIKNGNSHSAVNFSDLNSGFTFEGFVIGESNRFARAAALAVAEAPGQTRYNPLYVYGGVGLGKTHLLQAVGNFIRKEEPGLRLVYATSEKFTNDFISSLGKSAISEFHRLYRQADVLLIDDIQFLAGKESTQEQFFHTFNALHLAGKQIVLTSDRPPKEIKGLEERLLSRFQWGLVTDIQPPDLETRIAILNKKAEAEGITLPAEVAVYIAEHFISNVRELEGALIRVLAYSSLASCQLTLPLAQRVLGESIANGKKEIKIEEIIRQVASHYDLTQADLLSKRKTSEIAWARQVGMSLARSLTEASLKYIGAQFGGRDHSTVIHACQVVKEAIQTKPELKRKIDRIITSIYTL